MANKIFDNSRFFETIPILENDGKLIFISHYQPLKIINFPDNIIHTVRNMDRVESISSLYYGIPDFGWIISDFNNFLFSDEDLHKVETIILPSKATLETLILPEL